MINLGNILFAPYKKYDKFRMNLEIVVVSAKYNKNAYTNRNRLNAHIFQTIPNFMRKWYQEGFMSQHRLQPNTENNFAEILLRFLHFKNCMCFFWSVENQLRSSLHQLSCTFGCPLVYASFQQRKQRCLK